MTGGDSLGPESVYTSLCLHNALFLLQIG